MAALKIGVTSDGDLVAQRCGSHTLIRGRDEAAADAAALTRIPRVPGNALVLASAGAHRHSGLLAVVQDCVAALRFQHAEPLRTVWLAVAGLGDPDGRYVSWLHQLSVQFGVEVVASHGTPITGRGIGLHVDRAGWRRFSPGSDATAFGCRFPMPSWEHQVPLVGSGLVTEPVPAGLAVRPAGLAPLSPRDPRFQVPLDLRVPKLVVGEPVSPRAVAAIISRLQVWHDLLVVPAAEPVTTTDWARGLAVALNRGVDVATGRQVMSASGTVRTIVCDADGTELLEPLATILRHTPGDAPPKVRDIAPPPAGWQRHGLCYRPQIPSEAATAGVVAEVLPGGLHVRLDSDRARVTADFDPRRWTMVVGDEGRDVTAVEVAAVCDLLENLGPARCRTVDLHVLGSSWRYALSGFEAYLRSLGVVLERTAEPARVRSLPAADEPEVQPVPMPAPAPVPKILSAPAVSTFAAPVATVSGPRPQPTPASAPREDPAPPATEPPAEAVVVNLADSRPDSRVTRTRLIEIVDRDSTPAERTRFSLSAGADYAEALAAVNVALSAWPMLRAEAKADYVAVCLYLGRGPAGGADEAFDGYVPCLVSGLRRLPTHRKVVLRQENPRGEEHRAVGAVLWEPGFLSASTQLDITTPAAELDLLIWPVSARRTSELLAGRAVDEAVFPAGRRFKALAVRTRALLVRELLTDEDPESAEALVRDAAALPRLERAWEHRRQAELRLVDDEDVVARLTAPMGVITAEETLEAAS